MWDEEEQQQQKRNQMRVVMFMTILLLGYFYLMPRAPVVEPEDPTAPQVEGALPTENARNDADFAPANPDEGQEGEWPFLPEIARDLADDEVLISDDHLVLTFTKVGGRLKEAVIYIGKDGENSIQLVPESDLADSDTRYPLGLRFTEPRIAEELNRRRFEVERHPTGDGLTFTLELPGVAIIRKEYRLTENAHVLKATVTYESLEEQPRILGLDTTPAYSLYWGPDVVTHDSSRSFQPSVVWRQDGVNDSINVEKLEADATVAFDVDWFGYKSKYFLVTFRPEFEQSNARASLNGEDFRFGVTAPRFQAAQGELITHDYQLYIGPMQLASLGEAWDSLPSALTFFTMFETMDRFAKFLLSILHWFYEHTIPNYGVAIILLTIVVRAVMFPLTLKGMKSMKKMQALGPEMEALKEKYKDDQQELSKATMEMYRERGINPVGGCLPMFLQMPVFIALYRMLWNAYEMRGAPFLWVEDLSKNDCLFHIPFLENVPLVGQWISCFNLLPILMGLAMVISMKTTPTSGVQNPQQKMMMTLMPVIFSVFCYPLAAGLNLYVLTSTVLGIAQQAVVRASGPVEVPAPVKKNPRKVNRNKSVWTRTQQMKRQQKKDTKKQSAKETRLERVQKHQAGQNPANADDTKASKTPGNGTSKKKRKRNRKGKTK